MTKTKKKFSKQYDTNKLDRMKFALLKECVNALATMSRQFGFSESKTCHIVCNNNNGVLYCAHVCHTVTLLAQKHYYPSFSPAACGAEALEGINSCRVPIYYTCVERDNRPVH